MAYTPDAATDVSTIQSAPPAANATADTAPPSPPDIPATTGAPTAAAPIAGPSMPVAPTSQPKNPPSTFRSAFGPTRYQTDSNGQTTPVNQGAPTGKGLLGHILFGALEGATRGVAATTPEGAVGRGGAAAAGASAAEKGAKEADDKARAIQQRNFENQQQATAEKVRINQELATTAHITQNMNFEAEEHPGVLRSRDLQNQEAEMRLQGGQQKLLQDSIDFQDNMAKLGLNGTMFTEHNAELSAQVPAAVSGATRVIQNGQRGAGNGVVVYPKSQLDQPITAPVTYRTYDGAVDKDGVPIPTEHILQPDGKLTANDYLNRYFQGRSQLYSMQTKIHDSMTMQDQKAKLAETGAKTIEERAGAFQKEEAGKLSEAQAEQTKKMNSFSVTPAGYTPPPNAAIMSPQELGQYITSKGGQVPPDLPELQAMGRYDVNIDNFPTTPRKGDPRMARSDAVNYVIANINPAFKQSEYPARASYLKDFEGGKTGEGATRDRLNTAVQHLDLLGSAATAVAQGDIPLLNKVAGIYGVATGKDPVIVYKGIANKAAGEMAGAVKGGSGSATDQEIDKALENFDFSMSPEQQASNVRTHMQLLQGVENTLAGHFKNTMGQTPQELGHSVLFGGNEEKMNKWIASGTAPTGGATNPNANAGGQQQQPSHAFTTPQGTSFPLDQNGQFTANGWVYQASPDLKTAQPLHAATQGK